MTANQINYAKLIEERRHNIVSEGQTGMANIIAERNAESNRLSALTNQYSANIRAGELSERIRSDRANEILVAQRQSDTAWYQQEDARNRHEQNYNQRVSNQLKAKEIANQLEIARINDSTNQRGQDASTSASIISTLVHGAGVIAKYLG